MVALGVLSHLEKGIEEPCMKETERDIFLL